MKGLWKSYHLHKAKERLLDPFSSSDKHWNSRTTVQSRLHGVVRQLRVFRIDLLDSAIPSRSCRLVLEQLSVRATDMYPAGNMPWAPSRTTLLIFSTVPETIVI